MCSPCTRPPANVAIAVIRFLPDGLGSTCTLCSHARVESSFSLCTLLLLHPLQFSISAGPGQLAGRQAYPGDPLHSPEIPRQFEPGRQHSIKRIRITKVHLHSLMSSDYGSVQIWPTHCLYIREAHYTSPILPRRVSKPGPQVKKPDAYHYSKFAGLKGRAIFK